MAIMKKRTVSHMMDRDSIRRLAFAVDFNGREIMGHVDKIVGVDEEVWMTLSPMWQKKLGIKSVKLKRRSNYSRSEDPDAPQYVRIK